MRQSIAWLCNEAYQYSSARTIAYVSSNAKSAAFHMLTVIPNLEIHALDDSEFMWHYSGARNKSDNAAMADFLDISVDSIAAEKPDDEAERLEQLNEFIAFLEDRAFLEDQMPAEFRQFIQSLIAQLVTIDDGNTITLPDAEVNLYGSELFEKGVVTSVSSSAAELAKRYIEHVGEQVSLQSHLRPQDCFFSFANVAKEIRRRSGGRRVPMLRTADGQIQPVLPADADEELVRIVNETIAECVPTMGSGPFVALRDASRKSGSTEIGNTFTKKSGGFGLKFITDWMRRRGWLK